MYKLLAIVGKQGGGVGNMINTYNPVPVLCQYAAL